MFSRLTLRTKLTTLVLVVVTIGCYSVGKFMADGILEVIQRLFGLRAETAAVALVSRADVDWLKLSSVREMQEDASSQRFVERTTAMVHDKYIDRVEVVRYLDGNRAQHLVSEGGVRPFAYPTIGEITEMGSQDIYKMTTNGHIGVQIYDAEYMAGWAIIYDGTDPLGMVLVLIDTSETQEIFDRTQLIIMIAMGIIIVLSGLVAYRFASSFEKTAVTDGLMQLYNHRYFKQRLEQEVARAARHKHPLTLVMLDIDHFKKINDTWGHATGDIVLRLLGRWVKDQSRKTDVVARYGGEEVALILTDTALAGGQLFAERLREFVANETVRDPDENAEFKITISVGCAQWERGMSFLDLIRAADTALYHSKSGGRNRVSVYHEDLLPRPEKQELAKGKRG
ncbi:MAG TPA: GGDEF domain-containing protein [Symbiobacteriaceae bacterium]|nr:GGDEF domain-containing protein [Symbiobacteriaceae bacterium]